MASTDPGAREVAGARDRFYCHNIVVVACLAIYLLSDELSEVADHARAAARRLADRIGDLGGAITARSSPAHPATPSSPSPTTQTRGPSSPTPCGASTPSSIPTRPSWTGTRKGRRQLRPRRRPACPTTGLIDTAPMPRRRSWIRTDSEAMTEVFLFRDGRHQPDAPRFPLPVRQISHADRSQLS
jgi:hypothetical protein